MDRPYTPCRLRFMDAIFTFSKEFLKNGSDLPHIPSKNKLVGDLVQNS